MAATLVWENSTSSSTPTWNSVSLLRFKFANDNNNDTNDPLVRPATGTAYSYEKYCRINVTVSPAVQLTNLRLVLGSDVADSGGSTTGLALYRRFTSTYATPAQPSSNSGLAQVTTTGETWPNAGTVSSTTTGQWGDMVVLVLEIASTVVNSGELTSFNIIARYDEI